MAFLSVQQLLALVHGFIYTYLHINIVMTKSYFAVKAVVRYLI